MANQIKVILNKASFKYIFYVCLIFTYFASSKQAIADHLMGADISWQGLGNDTFLIKVHIYRNCNGISLQDSNLYLVPNNNIAYAYKLFSRYTVVKDITPICKNKCTRCGSIPNTNYGNPKCTFPYGIEEFSFVYKVVIAGHNKSYCDFTIKWEQCCRSDKLTTAGSGKNLNAEVRFNRCQNKLDNSAYFPDHPQMLFPLNQCVTYNMNVKDDDVDARGNRDSLVYSLISPKDSSKHNLIYNKPYSFDKPFLFQNFPLSSSPWTNKCSGFHLDSFSGDFRFKGTKADETVIAVKIQSYGKDTNNKPVLKSTVIRDMELIFLDYKNNIPILSGLNGGSSYDTSICAGSQLCFTVNSFDPDSADSVHISWNSGISSANLTVEKNKQFPRAQFCWTPSDADVSTNPYQFLLKVTDSNCTAILPGWTHRTYRIKVIPRPKPAIQILTDKCGNAYYSATAKGVTVKAYKWSGEDGLSSTSQIFTHKYNKVGTYNWKLETTNYLDCSRIDSGILPISHSQSVQNKFSIIGDSTLCLADTASFISSDTSSTNSYLWSAKTGKLSSGNSANIAKFYWTKIGIENISLFKTNKGGCVDTADFNVKILPIPNPMWQATAIGPRLYNFLANDTTLGKYSWDFGDNSAPSNVYKITHNYRSDSAYHISLMVKDTLGCRAVYDSDIRVNSAILYPKPPLLFLKISPNPFHEETNITYILSKAANVRISLADMQGKEIRTMTNQNQSPGEYTQVLDAQKSGIAPGVYLLKVFVDGGLTTKEIIRLR